MASFFETPLGHMTQLLNVMSQAGFTPEDVARINRNPSLIRLMYEAYRRGLEPQTQFWYVDPSDQYFKARKLWPALTIPNPPANFAPATTTEVVLLHVPQSLVNLWSMVIPPVGYNRVPIRTDLLDDRSCYTPHKQIHDSPVWLGFDPEHATGQKVSSVRMRPTVAAQEIISAMIQFPNWPLTWLNRSIGPALSGLQLLDNNHQWSRTLYLYIDPQLKELALFEDYTDRDEPDLVSPSIRRLS